MIIDYNQFKVPEDSSVSLKKYSTLETGGFDKKTAKKELKQSIKELKKLQRIFYADDRFSLLIVLQASDTAGKDGTIRHVMSGINPQGCRVHSFKAPSKKELDHDYLWRHYKALPYTPQQYLPDKLTQERFYLPTERGYEALVKNRLKSGSDPSK